MQQPLEKKRAHKNEIFLVCSIVCFPSMQGCRDVPEQTQACHCRLRWQGPRPYWSAAAAASCSMPSCRPVVCPSRYDGSGACAAAASNSSKSLAAGGACADTLSLQCQRKLGRVVPMFPCSLLVSFARCCVES